MTGFAPEWLALREPADRAARARHLLSLLCAWRKNRETLKVADIGAGSGSTLRAIAEPLGGRQDWLLLDRDPALLGRSSALCKRWAVARGWSVAEREGALEISGKGLELSVRTGVCDLAQSLDALDHAAGGLVTASALIDLVSRDWLEDLAARCASLDAAAYIALTYDGRFTLSPPLPDDSIVRDLVNQHQGRNKGFGAALGPAAAARAETAIGGRERLVRTAASDWVIGRESAALIVALCHGWASAAREQDPARCGEIDRWLARRCDLARKGLSAARVGHQDLLAVPRKSQSSSMS